MNKCNIEEVKWQARQKFLELAKEPDLWKPDLYPAYAYWRGTFLSWEILVYVYMWGGSTDRTSYSLRLNGEGIVITYDPQEDISLAITKIMDWHEEKRKQQRCLELQKAMQESCQKIQQALGINPEVPKKTLLQRLLNFIPFLGSNEEKD